MKLTLKRLALGFSAAAALVLTACATFDEAAARALRDRVAPLFGTVAPVSAGEPATAIAELGRALFWDTRLSLDGKTACASCHTRDAWSSDRRPLSINAKGEPTTLHSQSMFMAQDQSALRWYGDRRDGAHQAERSITGSLGFANSQAMVAALKANGYEPAFRLAFPQAGEPMSTPQYTQALAAYQRTLRTPAPFDEFLNGRLGALTDQQRAGLEKFVATGCATCHGGTLLGGDGLRKFGVVKDYWLATGSKTIDSGRFAATKKEEDRYVYRVPMLRNIAKTAPYFHDGSVATLEAAVRVMAEVQLGLTLGEQDVRDIAAFLESLTGEIPSHYAPPVRPLVVSAGMTR